MAVYVFDSSAEKKQLRTMHKDKILELATGFRGRAKNCIRIARERVEKALQYSYRDRRNKKRDMRSLWIQRINAGTRLHGVCSLFIFLLLSSLSWHLYLFPFPSKLCFELFILLV